MKYHIFKSTNIINQRSPIKFILLTVFLLLSIKATTQNIDFTRSEFPGERSRLRDARQNLQAGDELFNKGGGKYNLALEHYLEAHDFNPDNAWLNYKIGVCYLHTINYHKSVDFFENAIRLNVPTLDVYYKLGRAYQLNYMFDKAIDQYEFYRQNLTPEDMVNQRDKIDKRLLECENGKQLVKNPARVFIDNLGDTINSKYDDYSPVINADGSKMLFTTRRPLGRNPKLDQNDYKYFENVLQTRRINDSWETPQDPGRRINTGSHDATAGLSHNGKTLIMYRGDSGGNLYESLWEEDRWTRPKRLHRTINSKHKETSAALSPCGNILYFVSDRPGGYGGKDIWHTTREEGGNWSEPENLGQSVNTKYDEKSLFLHPDGKTLYFSSQGHNSMGGFDIFKTEYIDDSWSDPVNLGYPINTPGDDLFFSITEDNETGFYATYGKDGYGGSDIYMITFLGPEKPLIHTTEQNLIADKARPAQDLVMTGEIETDTTPMTILRGVITDHVTKEPLSATIELYDNEEDVLLAQFNSNENSGEYLISIPGGKNYGISVKADDYLFHSENINITDTRVYREIINDIELKKIEIGEFIILNNIFFDSGDSDIRPESYPELGVLYQLLVDNPTIRIEVSGHTDNTGSIQLNQRLSEERARSVVNYLIDRGIDSNRLVYRGYGFSRPIATNQTEEGRQLNRRTEFTIIEK